MRLPSCEALSYESPRLKLVIFRVIIVHIFVIMFDLSYIYPIVTGIVQILSLIASKVVFKENMTLQSIIGACIIIIGIVVMNLPKVKA